MSQPVRNTDELPAVGAPVERPVRPLVARLRHGVYGIDRIPLCKEAANEIERLRAALAKANEQAEHFERAWYMAKDDADRYAFAKTLEGQVVAMETFKNLGAMALDQALDDAMAEDADARNEAGYAA